MQKPYTPPKSAIPLSGKIPDFDITAIDNVDDADDGIAWLSEQITSMRGQISFRKARGIADDIWLSRINLALKRAVDLRHDCQVLRGRLRREETMARQRETERRFMDAALQVMEPEQLRRVWATLETELGPRR